MLARISKLVGALAGVIAAFLVMKIPFIAQLGFTPDAIAGQITTLVMAAITTYFAPKNAD